MENTIRQMQEQQAYMQAEINQLGEELYTQQKETAELRGKLKQLETKMHDSQSDSGIRTQDEETPPPHY